MGKVRSLVVNPFFLALFFFALAVVFINPIGEFTINDDWIFSRQILAFRRNIWKMSSLMDPIFISQGIMGYLWSLLFGWSHTSLRFLTLVVTLLGAYGVYRIARLYTLDKRYVFLLLIVFLFNPLIFTSAFSFMTENYFLLFFIWNLYYYLGFLKNGENKDLYIGTVCCALATLVRQVGAIPLLVLSLLSFRKVFRWPVVLIMGGALSAFLLFPRWPISKDLEGLSVFSNTMSNLTTLEKVPINLTVFPFIVTYLAFFVVPLFFVVDKKGLAKNKMYVLLKAAVALFIAYKVYMFDVFPIGSVLYLEGLHLKSWSFQNLSVFDNVFTKALVSLVSSYIAVYFLEFAITSRKKLNITGVFLVITALLNFLILLFSSAFYDRYILPGFISFLIFFFVSHSTKKFDPRTPILGIVSTIFFVLISVSLQYNFFTTTRLSWSQAGRLSEKYNISSDIFVLGLYGRYTHAVKNDDFIGYDKFPSGRYLCYVQPYTMDSERSFLLKNFQRVHDLIEKKIGNPSIYGGRKSGSLPRVKNHLNALEFNQEYWSPLYNPIGKRAYVGSFCVNSDGD